jgi:thiamine biosynthesis lipoprotein
VLRQLLRASLLLGCVLAGVSCRSSSPPSIQALGGLAQGTTYAVQWWSDAPVDRDALGRALSDELERLDRLLSNYRPDSTLEVFNAAQSVDPQSLPEELVGLLRLAADVHRASDGCFDPTVQPLVRAWGFDGDEPAVPSPPDLAAARNRVGFDKLEILDAGTVRKTVPGLEIDMASIGQGYTAGRMAAVVERLGIRHYIVEIGGELVARGHRPDTTPWRVGIEDPSAAGGPPERLNLPTAEPTAVITSGTYRHYFENDGRTYGHILDPRTGRPVDHGLVEVTVVGPDPARAAAWATALLCLGPVDAAAVADREALAALLAVRADRGIERVRSARFPAASAAAR